MFKKVFVAITLAVCFSGLSFSTGCSGPGDVVEGTADNEGFKASNEVDKEGRKAPDGTAIMD